MSPLDSIPKLFDTEAALRAEAEQVHPGKAACRDDLEGEDLYRAPP